MLWVGTQSGMFTSLVAAGFPASENDTINSAVLTNQQMLLYTLLLKNKKIHIFYSSNEKQVKIIYFPIYFERMAFPIYFEECCRMVTIGTKNID